MTDLAKGKARSVSGVVVAGTTLCSTLAVVRRAVSAMLRVSSEFPPVASAQLN